MNAIENIQKIVGIENVLTGERLDQYEVDPSGKYKGSSLAVVRPENTEQVVSDDDNESSDDENGEDTIKHLSLIHI